jgi:hypothetical protein
MAFLEWLGKVIKDFKPFDGAVQIHITNNSTTNTTTNTYDGNIVSYKNSIKEINLAVLSDELKKELTSLLPSAIDDGMILLEDNTQKLILELKQGEQQQDIRIVLDFLKPKISQEDLNIWRAALFMRDCYRKNDKTKTQRLKYQIMQKYGDKGRNITNLCTAEYVEKFLMPLHADLAVSHPDDAGRIFLKFYDLLVDKLPFSVFVCSKMSKIDIIVEIEHKKRYGVKVIYIHGIGAANIDKIRDAIRDLEHNSECEIEKKWEEENKTVVASIRFKIPATKNLQN